ncbi:hypothetical protein D9619_008649 [Psilocybe cf. subviscida]|uniref:IPT/TIG domain-containing protein n=1 Tax=Psilocybe cf. subviscida TaxID=2480587 RepID=A0A8H5BB83_9AGAR|nr:hypothetical protein D9619_008649 [Psilocybe cf. subviscida]
MKFFITSALLSLAVAFQAYAKPMPAGITPLDVFVPTIIQPNSASVWTAGQQEVVVWDTSNAPASISNGAAVTLSGLGSAQPLASGFDLRAGQVIVTVPANVTKGTHTITLFGDSGDVSQAFQIV